MYGKVMALRDDLIPRYMLLCTNLSLNDVEGLKNQLTNGGNPRDVKMILAREIVTIYHGSSKADRAEKDFIQTFQGGGVPENIETHVLKQSTILADLALMKKLVESKTEFTRLVREGAVTMDGNKITDPKIFASAGVLKVGKRRFLKIIT